VEALPGPLQVLRWVFPSTAGIQASLRLNQMGAPLHDVLPYLGVLLSLAVAGLMVLWVAATPRRADRETA
jgi:ABC-2 type transport system permease protein